MEPDQYEFYQVVNYIITGCTPETNIIIYINCNWKVKMILKWKKWKIKLWNKEVLKAYIFSLYTHIHTPVKPSPQSKRHSSPSKVPGGPLFLLAFCSTNTDETRSLNTLLSARNSVVDSGHHAVWRTPGTDAFCWLRFYTRWTAPHTSSPNPWEPPFCSMLLRVWLF